MKNCKSCKHLFARDICWFCDIEGMPIEHPSTMGLECECWEEENKLKSRIVYPERHPKIEFCSSIVRGIDDALNNPDDYVINIIHNTTDEIVGFVRKVFDDAFEKKLEIKTFSSPYLEKDKVLLTLAKTKLDVIDDYLKVYEPYLDNISNKEIMETLVRCMTTDMISKIEK